MGEKTGAEIRLVVLHALISGATSKEWCSQMGERPHPKRVDLKGDKYTRPVFDEGLAELHTHLGGSVASEILWSLAHEQGIALPVKDYWEFERLVTVSDPRGVPNLDALDADLPLDGADPVLADRGRALGARGDRRRLPLAAHHDARAALQPDEAKPRRRARPRPHHPRRDPRARPRLDRVPAGARGADPDDGPDVRRATERDHRREGDQVGAARRRRRRHRRPAPGRRPLRLHADRADGRDRARGRARRDDPRRRGGRRRRPRGDRARSSSRSAPTGSATGSSPPATRS